MLTCQRPIKNMLSNFKRSQCFYPIVGRIDFFCLNYSIIIPPHACHALRPQISFSITSFFDFWNATTHAQVRFHPRSYPKSNGRKFGSYSTIWGHFSTVEFSHCFLFVWSSSIYDCLLLDHKKVQIKDHKPSVCLRSMTLRH